MARRHGQNPRRTKEMTIIESKVIPGGSDPVPYGDSTCEAEYMDTYSGVIELEDTSIDFMRSGDWRDDAIELIYGECNGEVTLSDIYAYCDFSWQMHPTKPGTYLIKYSV